MLNIINGLFTAVALLYATNLLADNMDVDYQNLNATESHELINIKNPAVFIISSNSNVPFEVGKMYQFVSIITGDFPLKVDWKFQRCYNYLSCDGSSTQTIRSSSHSDILKTQYRFFTSIELVVDGSGKLICDVTNKFGNSIEMYTIIVTDVEIRPDMAELTLNSGDNRTLICKGSMPVQWYFNQYNQITPILNTSSTQIFSKNHNHLSRLSLNRVSYLDIGHYYCGPLITDLRLVQQNFKKIYIFVRDETHLIAIPDDLNAWHLIYNVANDLDLFVIPCRPTSPDVNVTLYVNGTLYYKFVENDKNWFDNNQGYSMPSSLLDESNVYLCHANRNNITESQTLNAFVNPKRPQISKSGGYLNHIVVGQNISLNCSVNIESFQTDWYLFELQWNIDTKKLQADHVQVDKKRFYQKAGSILLHIENVTRVDEGEYVCEQTLMSNGEKYRATYTLKTYLPDETYLHLSVLNDDFKTKRLRQSELVQWTIQVSAYPTAILEWRDPNGEKIGMNPEKTLVKNYDTSSKLIIKNIQMSDSGIYRLFADNRVHKKNISVTLLVEDDLYVEGPSIVVTGDNITIKCYASKKIYQHDIEWIHRSITNEDTPISTNENITIIKSETQLSHRSYLTIQKISNKLDGIIKCTVGHIIKQSNEKWPETAEFPIKVKDPINPVVYNSSGIINLELSNKSIQLYCYVGGTPPPTIWWFKDGEPLRFDENDFRALLEDRNQKLTIHFPEYEDKGEYICYATNKINYTISSITVNFTNFHKPIIYDSSYALSYVKKNEAFRLLCIVRGMPTPTIAWYKDDGPLILDEKNFRVVLLNNSQMLSIYSIKLEDQGTYVCNATNRFGSTVSTKTLIVNGESNEYFIILSLFGIFILVCVVCVVCFKREWKSALRRMLHFKNSKIDRWNSDLDIQEQAHLLPYDKRWEFPRNKLKLGKQLGSGTFGVIVKAKATGIIDKDVTTTVAVKMIKPNVHPRYTEVLDSELKIMIHVGRHLNLVNLLGACTKNKIKGLAVIVEYCCFGNIHRYLQKQRESFIDQVTLDDGFDYDVQSTSKSTKNEIKAVNKITTEIYNDSGTQITSDCCMIPSEDGYSNDDDDERVAIEPLCTRDLMCWSYQVARGMEYLAGKKIIHGDLATRNILLAEKNVVKISDLGPAKTMYNSEYYRKKSIKDLLPVKWMAIESLRDQVFSTRSDVWAFGIVLWEIFSLSVTPYPNIFTFEDLFNKLVGGYRMEIPKHANSKIYNIMLDCWNEDPMKRPSFIELSQRLGDLLQCHTKLFYDDLNETFMRIDTRRSPSNMNCKIVCKNNTNSIYNDIEQYENENDLELKPLYPKQR